VLDRVVETILRYNMLDRGARTGVAVSGGADSVCLLHLLHQLAADWNLSLHVLHLDHQLRGDESRADAAFVAAMSARFGLPCEIRKATLPSGENLEQAARQARYSFYAECRERLNLDRVATGHTLSDQAETVLFRILRGAGPGGLAGVLPVTREGIVRPLLDIARAEVEDYLRAQGIPWREDRTNSDTSFRRNRIRHELMPELRTEWNPALDQALARLARLSADEELFWESELDRLEPLARPFGAGWVVDATVFDSFPVALRRRALRRVVSRARGGLMGLDFRHFSTLERLVVDKIGQRVIVPGLDVMSSFGQVRFASPGDDNRATRFWETAVAAPGLHRGGPVQVSIQPEDCRYNEGNGGEGDLLDGDRLNWPLVLRNWRPGDAYQPAGFHRQEKIKFMFQEARIPLWERRDWPILLSGDAIVWARRFGVAAAWQAQPGSGCRLRVGEVAPDGQGQAG